MPSIPGFGFSGKPPSPGWDPDRIARTWAERMKRLGYTDDVTQGGDWGAPISSAIARQAPAGLLGIHLNYPASVPPEIHQALRTGDPAPAGMSIEENAAFDALRTSAARGSGYRAMMGNAPADVGSRPRGLARALAAFMDDYNDAEPQRLLTKDGVLDKVDKGGHFAAWEHPQLCAAKLRAAFRSLR